MLGASAWWLTAAGNWLPRASETDDVLAVGLVEVNGRLLHGVCLMSQGQILAQTQDKGPEQL